MRKTVFLSVFCALFSASAGLSRAAIWNDMFPGARPMGMGTAYTAVAEGPDAIFYNPAGTAQSDFPALAGSVARMSSRVGALSMESFSYARPLPILPGASVGAGFHGIHQENAGDKSAFLLHFSHALRLPQFHFSRPLKVGGNVRFENTAKDALGKHSFGLGLDAGALLEIVDGLTAGVSVLELSSVKSVPQPFLNIGTAYRWRRRITLSGDLRVRRSLTEYYPGVEFGLYQNLLKLRLGKGVPLDGTSQFTVGVGANFSPVSVDFAMAVPSGGIRYTGGGAQLSVQYRFGAPAFYGLFPGSAARESEDLRSRIIELEKQRADAQAQLTALSTDKTSLDSQVEAEEARLREMRDQLRQLEIDIERKSYEAGHPSPRKAGPEEGPGTEAKPRRARPAEPRPKRPASAGEKEARLPTSHLVKPGDTLRKLAERYYGDPSLWERIYEANPEKVERGLPVEGTVLSIPKASGR